MSEVDKSPASPMPRRLGNVLLWVCLVIAGYCLYLTYISWPDQTGPGLIIAALAVCTGLALRYILGGPIKLW